MVSNHQRFERIESSIEILTGIMETLSLQLGDRRQSRNRVEKGRRHDSGESWNEYKLGRKLRLGDERELRKKTRPRDMDFREFQHESYRKNKDCSGREFYGDEQHKICREEKDSDGISSSNHKSDTVTISNFSYKLKELFLLEEDVNSDLVEMESEVIWDEYFDENDYGDQVLIDVVDNNIEIESTPFIHLKEVSGSTISITENFEVCPKQLEGSKFVGLRNINFAKLMGEGGYLGYSNMIVKEANDFDWRIKSTTLVRKSENKFEGGRKVKFKKKKRWKSMLRATTLRTRSISRAVDC